MPNDTNDYATLPTNHSTDTALLVHCCDIVTDRWRHLQCILRGQHRLITQFTQSITHTHPSNGPLSRITRVSRYQKGKTNLDFTEARDSEWQWHQLGHMQVCTSLQTDNHTSTQPFSFLQARCPSCRPTNSVKALKAIQSIN